MKKLLVLFLLLIAHCAFGQYSGWLNASTGQPVLPSGITPVNGSTFFAFTNSLMYVYNGTTWLLQGAGTSFTQPPLLISGDSLYFNPSGQVNGYVLTSRGVNLTPTWQAAGGGGFTIPYISGRTNWYCSQMVPTSQLTSNTTVLQYYQYLTEIYVYSTKTFAAIGVGVNTNIAGDTIDFSIYNDSAGTLIPTSLIYDSAIVSTANHDSIVFASPITLTAGWYWVGVACSNASESLVGIANNIPIQGSGIPSAGGSPFLGVRYHNTAIRAAKNVSTGVQFQATMPIVYIEAQ